MVVTSVALPPAAAAALTAAHVDVHVAERVEDVSDEALAAAKFVGLLNGASAETCTRVLDACPQLQVVQLGSAGVEKVAPTLAPAPVVLCNAKGVYSSALAEYTIMSFMHFSKDVPRWLADQQEKRWVARKVGQLRGSTLGVVGAGDIGLAVARLGKAFGMRVVATTRRPRAPDDAVDVYLADLGDVLAESDFACLALPLTPATRDLVRREHWERAKPGQVVVNVGRGKTVVEDDLLWALRDGPLAAAALDVTYHEPLPADNPLWSMPNVLVSSHTADDTDGCDDIVLRLCVDNLQRFAAGGTAAVINVVDKDSGY